MDLQTVMLQEAHKAYPSHEEVDQWAARLLKQSGGSNSCRVCGLLSNHGFLWELTQYVGK